MIDLSRSILLDGAVPSGARLLSLLLVNGVLVAIAFRLFKSFEPWLAEYV